MFLSLRQYVSRCEVPDFVGGMTTDGRVFYPQDDEAVVEPIAAVDRKRPKLAKWLLLHDANLLLVGGKWRAAFAVKA